MRRSLKDPLLRYIESYFTDHLGRVRGASRHTLRAYAQALRLFFIFLAERVRRSIANLQLDHIQADAVLAFLDHVETARHNTPSTRNCRRAAIRGFVEHLLRHDIEHAAQYERILAIPSKKTRTRPATYWDPEVVAAILEEPDRATEFGARDHALLLFLYNTGARVSEAIAVRRQDLQLIRPHQVRLHGKGGKERFCPLWPDTASALVRLLPHGTADNDVVFRNRSGGQLTRDGVAYLLAKYVRRTSSRHAVLRRSRVSPHILRHSCAVALLQAGVDITVIRDYLGHASIATTSRYVTSNLQMKRDVLDKFWKQAGLVRGGGVPWRPKPALLRFLTSL
jgi:site-specific recombinase XerD